MKKIKLNLLKISCAMYFVALCLPVYELGNTAVFGNSYLWGESSSRVNVEQHVVWFIDQLEVAQHCAAAFTIATFVVFLFWNRAGWIAILSIVVVRYLVELRSYEIGFDEVVYIGFLGADPLLCICIFFLLKCIRLANTKQAIHPTQGPQSGSLSH